MRLPLFILQWLPICQGGSRGALGWSAELLFQSPLLPCILMFCPLPLCVGFRTFSDSLKFPPVGHAVYFMLLVCISLPETLSAIPPLGALSSFLLEYYLLCEAFFDRASGQGRYDLSSCSRGVFYAPRLEKLILLCSDVSASLPPSLVSERLVSSDCVLGCFYHLIAWYHAWYWIKSHSVTAE